MDPYDLSIKLFSCLRMGALSSAIKHFIGVKSFANSKEKACLKKKILA